MAAGAAIGALLVSLFLYAALSPNSLDESFQYLARAGVTNGEAMLSLSFRTILICLTTFAFGLFLPLGRVAIKNAKGRILSGWIIGIFIFALVQFVYLCLVIFLGSAVGAIYFIYNLVKLKLAKRAARSKCEERNES